MLAQVVDGKEGGRGDEHAVAHGARCCRADEDAVEQESGESAHGDNERPEEVAQGSLDNVGFVAEVPVPSEAAA